MNQKYKNLFSKIAIIALITILVPFICPKPVQAAEVGGKLFKPIKQLVLTIGDARN